MTNNQENIERDLQLIKKAITPSPDLVSRVARFAEAEARRAAVTHIQPSRYTWYPMALSKFLIPAAAVAVVAMAIIGFRNHGPVMTPSDTPAKNEQAPAGAPQGSRISNNDIDIMITSFVNDANAEQSIAHEADTEAALMDNDRAVWDSFIATYNANEY